MKKIILIVMIALLTCKAGFSQDTTYFDAKGGICDSKDFSYYRITTPVRNGFQTVEYFASGKIKMRGSLLLKDSLLKHGVYEYFLDSGLKEKTVTYKKNYMHGSYSLYNDSGSLKETGTYKKDKLSGENVQYYDSGRIKREAIFKKGIYNGKMAYYNEAGIKIGEGNCRDDVWAGKWIKYDNNGDKLTEIFYGTKFKIKDGRIKFEPNNYVWCLFDKESYTNYDSYLMRCVSDIQDKKHPVKKAPEFSLLTIKDNDVYNDFYKDSITKESYKFNFASNLITLEDSFIIQLDEDLNKTNVLVLKFKNGKNHFIIETTIDVDNAKRNEEILKDMVGSISSY